MLIKSFQVSCPPRLAKAPRWDLRVVLKNLKQAPYEPLASASDKVLTLKTLFLVALASAKRVSELHGLSRVVSHTKLWASVSLSLAPGFVTKNQKPEDSASYDGTFSIPALSSLKDASADDLLLCPVRALRYYLRRTKQR